MSGVIDDALSAVDRVEQSRFRRRRVVGFAVDFDEIHRLRIKSADASVTGGEVESVAGIGDERGGIRRRLRVVIQKFADYRVHLANILRRKSAGGEIANAVVIEIGQPVVARRFHIFRVNQFRLHDIRRVAENVAFRVVSAVARQDDELRFFSPIRRGIL